MRTGAKEAGRGEKERQNLSKNLEKQLKSARVSKSSKPGAILRLQNEIKF